jgi:hypothetical protein
MKKEYLKNGDVVYCTGCYLKYHKKTNTFSFDECDGQLYFDGNDVEWDKNNNPYIQ